jgi:hypothetical protein
MAVVGQAQQRGPQLRETRQVERLVRRSYSPLRDQLVRLVCRRVRQILRPGPPG